jgi:hypothetical protein
VFFGLFVSESSATTKESSFIVMLLTTIISLKFILIDDHLSFVQGKKTSMREKRTFLFPFDSICFGVIERDSQRGMKQRQKSLRITFHERKRERENEMRIMEKDKS